MAVALVGSAGAVASGTTSVTPTFGQSTTAGNLLIMLVAGFGSAGGISCSTPTGWTVGRNGASAKGASSDCVNVGIFYKPNCGSGEADPTSSFTSGTNMWAALFEFSGCATSSPLDRSGSGGSGAASSPLLVTMGVGNDTAANELLVSAQAWALTKAGTATTSDTYNNGATPQMGTYNNDSSSVADHYRFDWGVTTSNAATDQDSMANSNMNIQGSSGALCSFLLAAAPPASTDVPPYIGGGYYWSRKLGRFTRPKIRVPKLWVPEPLTI